MSLHVPFDSRISAPRSCLLLCQTSRQRRQLASINDASGVRPPSTDVLTFVRERLARRSRGFQSRLGRLRIIFLAGQDGIHVVILDRRRYFFYLKLLVAPVAPIKTILTV
jgi:hypothetical protein